MNKAVIYARYSSHKQREESIERQVEICRKYAEDNGYAIVGEYCDRAQTGKNDNRPAFQKMLTDAKSKQFQIVLVWKFDRFARNRYDSIIYKSMLASYKVKVRSATEPVPEGASGILIEGMYDNYAEYYSVELAEKVAKGMVQNAEKGMTNGGARTYGYDIEEKRYVLNPLEANVVRKVFEMYAEGETVRSILHHCSIRGYKTPQGREFGYNFIDRMLKNKKYIGLYAWGEVEQAASIPAIVDERVFAKVQKRMAENSNTGARKNAKEDYVLVGKAFCGCCEQPLIADSVTKKIKNAAPAPTLSYNLATFDKISESLDEPTQPQEDITTRVYRYYVCRATKRKAFANGCRKKRIDKDKLENAVISYTAKQYLSDKNIEELAKAIYKVQKRVTSDPNIKELEYKVLEEAKKIENLYVMVESGHFTDKIFERIQQAELRKEDYEAELHRLSSTMPKLTLEQVKQKLLAVRKKMQHYIALGEIPINVKKAFCDAFIEKVYLFDVDPGGSDDDTQMKVKIVFDAFEAEDLLGFDDAEFEISSTFEPLGSPNKNPTPKGVGFLFDDSYGIERAALAQPRQPSVRWTLG